MIHVDRKYLHLLSPRLERFVRVKEDLYRFRCPLCGDSKKNKFKTRGYIFRKKGDYFFHCHNCGTSHTLYNFLHIIDPTLCKEYAFERFREANTVVYNPEPEIKIEKPVFRNVDLPSIKDLPEGHYAKSYVQARLIPLHFHSQLYFAEDFKAYVVISWY